MDNNFIEQKLLPRFTFNPGLALTDFRTTRPRVYGANLFPIDLWPRGEVCRPQNEGEKRGTVTYSTDRED